MSFLVGFFLSFTIVSSKVITCNEEPCIITPTAKDVVICTNATELCHIDCSLPYQCSKDNNNILRIYSGAKNTIIQCSSDHSCYGANIYIGKPKTELDSVYQFGGDKVNYMMDCNGNNACLETYISIDGNFVNGISINAVGKHSFKDALLECKMDNSNQYCGLICGRNRDNENSCYMSNFYCYNGDCDCYGSSCPKIAQFTPKPTTQSPTVTTKAPVLAPSMNPTIGTVPPTNNPSISPVFSPSLTPTVSPITPATIVWRPKEGQTVVCDHDVDICIINCDKARQCNRITVYSAARYTMVNCNNVYTCDNSFINIGKADTIPVGYDASDFINKMTNVIIDCNHDHSCNNIDIKVNGDVKDGLHVSALGISSIDGSKFHCNLEENQLCRLDCGNRHTQACIFSSMLCTGGNCVCYGETCPQTIYVRTPSPTLATPEPTFNPTKSTNNPTMTPSEIPTSITSSPTTATPTKKPTQIPTDGTLIPTDMPTNDPTFITLPPTLKPTQRPTDIVFKTFTPDGESRIVCTNKVHTCMINCFGYQQCKPTGDGSLEIFSAAKHTIINCNNRDSCFGAVMYIGIPSILPAGLKIEDFLGEFDSVRIDCGYVSSCKDVEIHIRGNFTNGATVNAASIESFGDAYIKCYLGNKQDCILNCGNENDRSCYGSDYICYGGKCRCNGDTCPEILFETPVPYTPGYFACEPLSSTNECINNNVYQADGLLDCPWGYSCCACDHVICDNCEEVNCGSTYSCAGTNLTINGNVQTGSGLTCGDNAACMYSTIIGENINRISCAGDMSCQYTYMELNMKSKKLLAVEPLVIPCNGDESCQNTVIYAKNLRSITCNGDVSCSNTTFNFECYSTNVNIGCSLLCTGDNACQFSDWDIINVDTVQCSGDDTCQYGNYNIKCLMVGCPVTCVGPRACIHARFNIENTRNGLDCTAINGCTHASFYLNAVKSGPIFCDDLHACEGTYFNMNLVTAINCNRQFGCTNAHFDVKCETIEGCSVSCGQYGCQGAIMDIKNDVVLINCWGDMACENTTMNIQCKANEPCPLICSKQACQHSSINILSNAESIECNDALACQNSSIIANCHNDKCHGGCDINCGMHGCEFSNITAINSIKSLNCSDIFACSKANIIAETMYDDFNIYCNSWSCQYMKLNVTIKDNECNTNKEPQITKILCDNSQACNNAIITIDNRNRNTVLNIKNITCNGIQSCYKTKIHILGNINVENIHCNPRTECDDLLICDPTIKTGKYKCPTPSPTMNPTILTINPTLHPPTYPTSNPTDKPITSSTVPPNSDLETIPNKIDNSNTVIFSIIFTFIFILICANLLYFCKKYKWYTKVNYDSNLELKPIKLFSKENNNNQYLSKLNNNSISKSESKPKYKINFIKSGNKSNNINMNMDLINKVQAHTPKVRNKNTPHKSGIISGFDDNNIIDGTLNDKEYLNLYYDTFNAGNNNEIDIDDNDIDILNDIQTMQTND